MRTVFVLLALLSWAGSAHATGVCFGPSQFGNIGTVDCAPAPQLWDNAYRGFSREETPGMCEHLSAALEAAGAARMIVGHTVQKAGINSACEGRVWRIDVGIAAAYGGRPAVLEIVGEEVRVLSDRSR